MMEVTGHTGLRGHGGKWAGWVIDAGVSRLIDGRIPIYNAKINIYLDGLIYSKSASAL